MTTTENNKMIAEFMNYTIKENELFDNKGLYIQPINESLKFHSDWNWLMEVVEKIESLGYWINRIDGDVWIQNNDENVIINNTNHQGGKEAVYNACIEFIKWYNQNAVN